MSVIVFDQLYVAMNQATVRRIISPQQQHPETKKKKHPYGNSTTGTITYDDNHQTRHIIPASNQASVRIQEVHSRDIPTARPQQQPEEQEELLSIDENSTISSDIVKIWHDIDSKSICVALRIDSRCPHPAFLGRLSGPGLAILEWNEQSRMMDVTTSTTSTVDTDGFDGTVLCGAYDHYWLDPGYYFVEVIILHCKDFGAKALERTDNNNMTAWMVANHTEDCVEDSRHNRITSKNGRNIIHIPTLVEGKDNYNLGRWTRKPGFPLKALFTRSQPLECAPKLFGGQTHKRGSSMHLYCDSVTNRDNKDGTKDNGVSGLYEYGFQWNMTVSEQQVVEKLRQRLRDNIKIPKICAVGDSHSRYMVDRSLPELNLTGLFVHVDHPWVSPGTIGKKVRAHKCDVAFVQVGQFPASFWSEGHPFSFGKYHNLLKMHVQNILGANPNATVYLPTIDQAPLMAKVNNCSDWRTPTMLDGYSYVNQMIVEELNDSIMTDQVKYVDTNFIINTHWDGHHDWQHLLEIVRSRKTIYMAAVMLGETEWAGLLKQVS